MRLKSILTLVAFSFASTFLAQQNCLANSIKINLQALQHLNAIPSWDRGAYPQISDDLEKLCDFGSGPHPNHPLYLVTACEEFMLNPEDITQEQFEEFHQFYHTQLKSKGKVAQGKHEISLLNAAQAEKEKIKADADHLAQKHQSNHFTFNEALIATIEADPTAPDARKNIRKVCSPSFPLGKGFASISTACSCPDPDSIDECLQNIKPYLTYGRPDSKGNRLVPAAAIIRHNEKVEDHNLEDVIRSIQPTAAPKPGFLARVASKLNPWKKTLPPLAATPPPAMHPALDPDQQHSIDHSLNFAEGMVHDSLISLSSSDPKAKQWQADILEAHNQYVLHTLNYRNDLIAISKGQPRKLKDDSAVHHAYGHLMEIMAGGPTPLSKATKDYANEQDKTKKTLLYNKMADEFRNETKEFLLDFKHFDLYKVKPKSEWSQGDRLARTVMGMADEFYEAAQNYSQATVFQDQKEKYAVMEKKRMEVLDLYEKVKALPTQKDFTDEQKAQIEGKIAKEKAAKSESAEAQQVQAAVAAVAAENKIGTGGCKTPGGCDINSRPPKQKPKLGNADLSKSNAQNLAMQLNQLVVARNMHLGQRNVLMRQKKANPSLNNLDPQIVMRNQEILFLNQQIQALELQLQQLQQQQQEVPPEE